MNRQERLLPGTRGNTRGSVSTEHYHGKILVRYRHLDGTTEQRQFTGSEEAHAFFTESTRKLADEAKARAQAQAPPPWKREQKAVATGNITPNEEPTSCRPQDAASFADPRRPAPPGDRQLQLKKEEH